MTNTTYDYFFTYYSNIKKNAIYICFLFLLVLAEPAYSQSKWSINPFNQKTFIENKGQYNKTIKTKNAILFMCELGKANVFFTKDEIIYTYNEVLATKEKEEEKDEAPKYKKHKLSSIWEGANSDVEIETIEKQNYFYATSSDGINTIKAAIYKKIVYKNLYDGIDIEYYFPKDGDGLKYNIIIHPDGDITKVKLNYRTSKAISMDIDGNINVPSSFGTIIDHAPTASVKGEIISSSFKINKNTIGFNIDKNVNKNETIIIDPWVTNPAFAAGGWSYDLDYDNQGNVYVYGDWNKKLIKLNSAGTVQWLYDLGFNAAVGYFGLSQNKYGDMAVDKINGSAYVLRGLGATIIKFSTSGNVVTIKDFATSNFNEAWRIAYNNCTSKLIIGSGGANPGMRHQIFTIDTNMNYITSANVGFADEAHDAALLAIDPKGDTCYMALASRGLIPNAFDNILVKLPAATLSPTTYFVPSGFLFAEQSPKYNNGNGMNGMVVGKNWLYTYDGATLKRVNKNTGIPDMNLITNTTPFRWAGIDVDECDNLYVGNKTKIDVYNSAMSIIAQIPATDTIYDLVLGANDTILYACGRGYISAIKVAPALIPSISKIKSPTSCSACNGNATATLNMCGTTNANVSYKWSNGQTNQTATNLCAGIYTVSISLGACQNQYTDTVEIFSSGGAGTLSVSNTQTPVLCKGDNTGRITLTPSGGNIPYSYAWNNGTTGATATSLVAGIYSCTITDGGCSSKIVTITITEPNAINVNEIQNTPASCGISNGSASVSASGGTGLLNYSWSATETSASISNKAAGAYIVTVTDVNLCTNTLTVSIGSNGGATISSVTKNDANCFAANGNATVNISGGASGNYTYSWSNGASTITTATSNNQLLTSNTYTVTVIDGACSSTTVINITEPLDINLSAAQSVPASCGLSNGIALATPATGGNGGFNYNWTNAATGLTYSGLAAGVYTVTATDSKGCTKTAVAAISNSPAPTINSLIPTNPLCNNGTGSASVNATGNTALTYTWSNGNTGTTTNNLNNGINSITVTDANNCSTIQTFTITIPSAINTNTVSITPASCGISNGSASVSASGGTGNLNYSWSATELTAAISNKTSGNYIVTVTDINSCTATLAVNIGSNGGANISSATKNDATCFGGNGNATVNISGGVSGNYTYSWSNGTSTITSATSNQELLTANLYTVTVMDGACSTTTVVSIGQPAPLAIGINKTNASCAINNGSITAAVSNGTANYTFVWSAALGYTNTSNSTGVNIINNLTADSYSLVVTDNNNCTAATAVTIINSGKPTAAISATTTIIEEGASTLLTASGGISYLWTPPTALSCTTCPSPTANPTITTTYTLVINDAWGCIDSTDITINVKKPCADEEDVFIANVFSPNNDGKNDVLLIQGNGLTNIYFTIYDRWGNNVFETRDQAQGWDGNVNGNKANAGTYVYYLKATCKKTLQEIILKGNVSVVR